MEKISISILLFIIVCFVENYEIEDCKCVPSYQCENNSIIMDGSGIFTVRSNGEEINVPKCKDLHVMCCKNGMMRNPTYEIKVPPPAEEIGCGYQRGTTIFEERMSIAEDKEDDSYVMTKGEFPWTAVIYMKKFRSSKYKYQCGGSLIHPKVILTGVYCVRRVKTEYIKVIVNGDTILPDIGQYPDDERFVSKVIKHNEYYDATSENDIALLILEEPYDVSGNKKPINTLCLPNPNQSYDNSRCIVAGFGKKDIRKHFYSDLPLKMIQTSIVNHDSCQNSLRKTELGNGFTLANTFVCAGEEGSGACDGDAGYPLICENTDGGYTQVGIYSWGIERGITTVPGVYTNVQKYRKWIENELIKMHIHI